MKNVSLPLPLAKGALSATPAHLLSPALQALLRRIKERHPRLEGNLKRLNPALVRFEVTDLPHAFGLSFGGGQDSVFDLWHEGDTPQASVRGSLQALLDMLEGRIDGDTLFFARDITITGDSEVVVGLRNTLDREAINVMEDGLSFLGRFGEPAALTLALAERVATGVRKRIARFHASLHEGEHA